MTTNITINECCNANCSNVKYYTPGQNGGDYTPHLIQSGPTIVYNISIQGSGSEVLIWDANTTSGLSNTNIDSNYLWADGGSTVNWSFGPKGLPLQNGLVAKVAIANTAGFWAIIVYE